MNHLQPQVNLHEYSGYFTVILHAELVQFRRQLACKITPTTQ